MRNCVFVIGISLLLVGACCPVWSEEVKSKDDKEVLALPSASSPEGRKLVLGQKLSLTGLGPLVVGEDGTLRRIANWDKLSAREKQVAFARLNERNQERLKQLKEQQKQGKSGGKPGSGPGTNGAKPSAAKDHLTKYLEALEALNKVTDGKDLQHELLKQAGLSAEGKGGKGGGLDYAKLQATLELLRNQQDLKDKKTEL